MKNRVATVIRCANLVAHVYATLESVERQTLNGGEIVLVTDQSTPALALEWIVQFARARGLLTTHALTALPGEIRNVGVRATESSYLMCLDAGDLLDPHFHELGAAKLDEDPEVDIVTSWIQVLGPGSIRRVLAPQGGGLTELVGNTDAIHGASMFRRDTWRVVGGFDESLPALEDYDFWLRALHGGRGMALIDRPLLIRRLRPDALYRRAWADEQHVAAVHRLVDKHATLFGSDPAAALAAREVLLQELGEKYRQALGRRDDAVRALEALKTRSADLRQALAQPDGVDLADLRRTTPLSRDWGYERGTPIDRHYIEKFLEAHAADIRGAVLEVQEADYTKRFGGGRVTKSDVVDLNPFNPQASIVSDLRSAANIGSNSYDCVILTQTLHVVDDMKAVISECARILSPGGVLLATLPCASRVCLEYGDEGDFWRVTEAGARTLFAQLFPDQALDIEARGNVLVNAAFLYGLGCHELTQQELDSVDPYFPLLVTVRAVKSTSTVTAGRPPGGTSRRRPDGRTGAAILLYHRVTSPESDIHGLSIPPQEFRAQMAHLREHYHPMPLDALVATASDGHVPAGGIAVTFDDGYVDNYTDASPILSAFGVPATFFISTDRLGPTSERGDGRPFQAVRDYEFWWDALERILLSPRSGLPSELRIDLPDGAGTFATATSKERMATHAAIYGSIVASPASERDGVIAALTRWSGLATSIDSANRRMRPAEIVALSAREGHAIGAHTARHLMLPRQPFTVQCEEVDESRRALETLLARRVSAFAYPFGAFSEETVEAVRAASFDTAVTCEDAALTPVVDLLRLPRLEVRRTCTAPFADWLESRLAFPQKGSRSTDAARRA